MKLMMIDLDGTLFDTKEVNYRAYQAAMAPYGFNIDFKYYCEFCNGRYYMDFLPQITTSDKTILSNIHQRKKELYSQYLKFGRVNQGLVNLIKSCKNNFKVALVTTASKQNAYDILTRFSLVDLFDLILTHDDIEKSKPDPEGFLKAMNFFHAKPEDCVIFEDSEVGIKAADQTGATVFAVRGFY